MSHQLEHDDKAPILKIHIFFSTILTIYEQTRRKLTLFNNCSLKNYNELFRSKI